MHNHSKSFLFSLAVHSLILLSLFVTYRYVFSSYKPVAKEKRICVNLTCVKEQAAVVKKQETVVHKQKVQKSKPVHKKIIKKTVKKKKTPEKQPKRVKKKVPLKKEIKKEEPQVSEVESPKLTKNPKTVEKPLHVTKEEKLITEEVIQKRVSYEEEYIENNLAEIAKLIKDNLYYPRMARKRGIQGSVTVRFMLLKDATVTQITTISSSSGILTRAAIKTIAELSGKFPKPKRDLMLTVPIQYSLH